MASFVVDITAVRFAGANTGYKDITITGMPQAGVSCTITGTDASSFGYRIPGQDQNVYRVYTTSHSNIGVSSSSKSATFKITNAGDSTDYVEVSLYQVPYYGCPAVRGVANVYDNIYAYFSGDSFSDATLFAEYRTDNVGTYAILYVDGYEGTTTLSESWAYYTAEGVYTDTGFKQIKIGATNNYDSECRRCTITFPGTNTGNSSKLYQNAYPSSSAGCTSPVQFTKDGGTERITLKTDQQPAANIDPQTWFTNDGLTYTIVESGSGTLYYDVTLGANQDNYAKSGVIMFERWSTHKKYGFAIIRQDASSGPTPTLTVDPSVLTYPSSGGARLLDVTYATSLSTNASLMPSWLGYTSTSIGPSNKTFTISAASNDTSVARDWDFELSDATMAVTVPITQAAGQASSLSISPSSNSVTNSSGSVQITVTAVGISEINYSCTSWISYSGKSGSVYTFTYTANTTTSQRTGTITFYGGGLSETYTLIQAAGSAPSLVVSPTSDSVSSGSGTYQVTVTPTNISSVSYSISDNWLSYSSKSGNVYTFSYTANTTSAQRQSVVTFTGDGISRTFTLTQAGSSYGELSANPSSLTFTKTGGQQTISLTYTGVLHLRSDTPDWISEVSYDIGGSPKNYYVTASENTSQYARQWNMYFYDDNSSLYVPVIQNGTSGRSMSISPSSGAVSADSGRQAVYITASGISASDISYSISGGSGWLSYATRSDYTFYFAYTANTTESPRTATITFSGMGKSATYTLTQQVASVTPTLTISPTSKTVSGASASVNITVEQTGIDNLQYSGDNFMFSHITGNVYTFAYGVNTSTIQTKTSYLTFTGAGLTRTFTLTQQPQSTTMSLNVTPTTDTVDSGSGYVYMTVIKNRMSDSDISWTVDGNWLSYVDRAWSVFRFAYVPNTTAEPRIATITFTGRGLTATYTLTQQAGGTPVIERTIKAHPSKLRFYKEGSTKTVSFTNRPSAGVNYTITYTDGSGWLTISGTGKDRYVTASANDGIRRRANIRFYDSNNSENYVDVPVIQGGDGYDSIWLDQMYYPEDRDANNNYYYRLVDQDSNSDLFVGISSIPAGWGGDVGGIDIPRLVDNYLDTYFWTRFTNDWAGMYEGFKNVDVYNMTEDGYPGTVDASFKYWNDWSRFERRYDYTRALNDPINGKGREDMIMPFCVYYGEPGTFNIVETEKNGNVNTYTFATPEYPFSMRYDRFYDTKTLVYRKDDEILFTYDMTHCGPGALIYRNRFGGWDSFLIEGNISKTDNYTKQNFRRKGDYNSSYVTDHYGYFVNEKRTSDVDINATYEAYTGWLTDDEAQRLAFHLLSSPTVYFQDFTKTDNEYDTDPLLSFVPVRITASSAEYKKFRNGKRLVNYLITFEKSNTEKVKY